jgi:BirA family biotin operon repressor/biotin-[acetyl-CoA-carboxylase] ligase
MSDVQFGGIRIRLERTGSTNSYARLLIEHNGAVAGLVVTAEYQTSGRGQANRHWESEPSRNLLCSYIFFPAVSPDQIFIVNKMVACAVHQCLQSLVDGYSFEIKWPNDIMAGQEKIAGMLIETGIRQQEITHCIAGIGVNVNQEVFKPYRPKASSLKKLIGHELPVQQILSTLNSSITRWYPFVKGEPEKIENYYHAHLYGRGKPLRFIINGTLQEAIIEGADDQGHLLLRWQDTYLLKVKHHELKYVF